MISIDTILHPGDERVQHRTVELCSITGDHAWRDDECTTCGARIRRDLPRRDQIRKYHADLAAKSANRKGGAA